jgi:hypothetical protein
VGGTPPPGGQSLFEISRGAGGALLKNRGRSLLETPSETKSPEFEKTNQRQEQKIELFEIAQGIKFQQTSKLIPSSSPETLVNGGQGGNKISDFVSCFPITEQKAFPIFREDSAESSPPSIKSNLLVPRTESSSNVGIKSNFFSVLDENLYQFLRLTDYITKIFVIWAFHNFVTRPALGKNSLGGSKREISDSNQARIIWPVMSFLELISNRFSFLRTVSNYLNKKRFELLPINSSPEVETENPKFIQNKRRIFREQKKQKEIKGLARLQAIQSFEPILEILLLSLKKEERVQQFNCYNSNRKQSEKKEMKSSAPPTTLLKKPPTTFSYKNEGALLDSGWGSPPRTPLVGGPPTPGGWGALLRLGTIEGLLEESIESSNSKENSQTPALYIKKGIGAGDSVSRDSKNIFNSPKGYLFVGPPGTGKTLLAQAIAEEAAVPLICLSASEIQKQIEIGTRIGALRLRKLFDQARKLAPCILFLDEIDSIGGARLTPLAPQESFNIVEEGMEHPKFRSDSRAAQFLDKNTEHWTPFFFNQAPTTNLLKKNGGALLDSRPPLRGVRGAGGVTSGDKVSDFVSGESEYYSQKRLYEDQKSPQSQQDGGLFTEFLIQMDSFSIKDRFVVIGTTNNLASLDSAFIRAGRFDRILGFTYPSKKARIDILKFYSKKFFQTKQHTNLNLRSPPDIREPVNKLLTHSVPSNEVSWNYFGKYTNGFSPAHLSRLVNEARLYSISRNKKEKKVSFENLQQGFNRIIKPK